jgi:hypothetical protein
MCGHVFIPGGQRLGIIDPKKLRTAVEKDSLNTGIPIVPDVDMVKLEVEKLNAENKEEIH